MKLPLSFYNPLTLIGSLLASLSLLIIIFFLLAMTFFNVGGSYTGLLVFMVLPALLILGLILIPIGMIRASKRNKKADPEKIKRGIKLDLNNRRHRNGIAVFVLGSFVFLLLTGIGSYKAFHYSESNEFCGTLCHKVMEPEYTAYQASTHSRVTCVECHVGEGADWYVKSKLSGLYQVYAVLSKIYPKPIPTPIESLRPARETCEHCHWPEKFYSYRIENEKHYLADSGNTEWNIQLMMKIGSEHSTQGLLEGIHWHINKEVKIEYIASTRDREYLPWVRYINSTTNDTIVYEDLYEKLDQEAIDTLEIREMDCLDCHNRPSHNFLPPQEFTDLLISSGDIPAELPGIKKLAMEVFNDVYDNTDTARMLIWGKMQEYYNVNYPGMAEENQGLIQHAFDGFMKGFEKNIFPGMGASWDVYPNHIGHIEYNGCFRCHNGNHVSADNRIISRDCNLCHTILGQGFADNYASTTVNNSLEFKHPVDIGESWKEYSCAECHRYLY